MKYLQHIDLNKNELRNSVIQILASDPGSPVEGQIYYNSVNKKLRQYNGSTWVEYGTGGGGGDMLKATYDNSGTDGVVDNSEALGGQAGSYYLDRTNHTGSQAISTVTGLQTALDGKLALAGGTMAGDIDMDGNQVLNVVLLTGTDISVTGDVEAASLSSGGSAILVNNDLDMQAALITNLGTPSASTDAATKGYVDTAVTGLLDFKGSTDASTNPNYPAASAGDTYVVSVAGKVGGASGKNVEVGDMYLATADNAGGTEASVGTSWTVLEHNLVGALLGSNNLSDVGNAATAFSNIKQAATTSATGVVELATQAEAQAKTDTTRALTAASVADFARKYTGTIGDGSSTSIAVTHGLGSQYVTAQAFDASTGAQVFCDVTLTSGTQTTFAFTTAPASNAIRVVITG